VGFYLADLDRIVGLFAYATSSCYQCRKMRTLARVELAVSQFMRRKGNKGGRPSKLLQYFCCLGRHVEEVVAELSYGGKANRRRENTSLHLRGTTRLVQVWRIVQKKTCCLIGEKLELSIKTVHRAMHDPARRNSVAGRLHKGYADMRFHKVRIFFTAK
jgi:hypothetical protein